MEYLFDLGKKPISDFTSPANPGLGAFHPLNVFRTPFSNDRRKVSWNYKTSFSTKPTLSKLSDATTSMRFEIKRQLKNGKFPDLLVGSSFLINVSTSENNEEDVKFVKRVTKLTEKFKKDDKEDEGRVTTLLDLIREANLIIKQPGKSNKETTLQTISGGNNVFKLQTLLQSETSPNILNFITSSESSKIATLPFFYTSLYNKFFPFCKLSLTDGDSFIHEFKFDEYDYKSYCCIFSNILNKFLDIEFFSDTTHAEDLENKVVCCDSFRFFELWFDVVFLTPDEEEAIRNSVFYRSPMPPLISSSFLVPKILKVGECLMMSGENKNNVVWKVEKENFIFGVAWKPKDCCTNINNLTSYSYSFSLSSNKEEFVQDEKVFFKDLPDIFLKRGSHAIKNYPEELLNPSSDVASSWRLWTTNVGIPLIWPLPCLSVSSKSQMFKFEIFNSNLTSSLQDENSNTIIELFLLSFKFISIDDSSYEIKIF